jgi:hypothetical protein
MGKICRETHEFIEQHIETQVAGVRYTCESFPWWNPIGWFCWAFWFVVWVVVTIVKWVTRVVCEVVNFVLDIVALTLRIIFLIPVIGGILRTIWNWTLELFWRFFPPVAIGGWIDFGLTLLGVQIPKRMHLALFILRKNGQPLITKGTEMRAVTTAQNIYKTECNIDLIYYGAWEHPGDAPDYALTAGCDAEGFFKDWGLAGSFYEQIGIESDGREGVTTGWRRFLGFGGEIIAIVVEEITPAGQSVGCSFGPTHDHLVMKASQFTTINGADPTTLAHEMGHACGLIAPNRGHDPSPNNLMYVGGRSGTTLNRFQRAVARTSRHCTLI